MNLFVKYKRSGTFKKANIITTSPLKVNIFVLLLAREREREICCYQGRDYSQLELLKLFGMVKIVGGWEF